MLSGGDELLVRLESLVGSISGSLQRRLKQSREDLKHFPFFIHFIESIFHYSISIFNNYKNLIMNGETISAKILNTEQIVNAIIDKRPDICPFCHDKIRPEIMTPYTNKLEKYIKILYLCPGNDCNELFIGYYSKLPPALGRPSSSHIYYLIRTSIGNLKIIHFEETINNISENFVNIYNESYNAEQYNFKNICGVGYRKALEFLIKDYLIKLNPEQKDKIVNSFLKNCINNYITNDNIKDMSKRAAWIGNDETHYNRIWKEKDLEDLKDLIGLTVYWINSEELTKKMKKDMPE